MSLGRHLRQNLVAYLALGLVLGTGTAYAADRVANGSITTKKLATSAVTSTKIKNGAVKAIDLGRGSVTSFTLADGSVTSTDLANGTVGTADVQDGGITSADLADGTVASADIKDDTIVRQDIQDAVVPQDADIFVSSTGQTPSATPAAAGLNPFQVNLPRNGKLAIEFFAGALGVDCSGGGQGQVGIYIDGAPHAGTLTDVPASGDAGAVQLVTNQFLNAGVHTFSIGEQCASGTHGPTVPAQRVTWTVHLLAR